MELYSLPENEKEKERVQWLADRLKLTLVYEKPDLKEDRLLLIFDKNGLALSGDGLILHGDFTRMLPRIKGGRVRSELLVRAARLKDLDRTPTVVDATAGLGEDSFLLAAAGFSVQLYEYNPIIKALLEDSMRRAGELPELKEIVDRMELFQGDSIEKLNQIQEAPDVVLLDPMFPARQKSALVKKKFQLLQQLEQPCNDEEELLQAAINAHPRKIVIKRPPKGPHLAGVKPSYSIEGKGIRYDCLMIV